MLKNRASQIILFVCLSISSSITATNETKAIRSIAKAYPKVCGDVRITLFELRRGINTHALASCEIILGSVTYAPVHSFTNSSAGIPIRFPYLREVYGYILLGYSSMRTFYTMFPRLAIVHGRELYHGYSLIIMDNFLLVDIGLVSLINIRRGNIIIARNAQLCYTKSLRWSDILESKTSQVISRQNRENCAYCPTCPSACWSPTQCQKRCLTHCKGNCFSETICCPEQCVGGCYSNSTSTTKSTDLICSACQNMRIYATGICVQQCPPKMLKAGGSLCVTRDECKSFFMGVGFILEEINECVLSCPAGFLHAPGSRCTRCISSPENGYCHGACGEKHIRSVKDFQSLKYCTRVHTLNIYNIATVEFQNNHYLEAFTALAALEQIDQEFTIHNVKIFSTLNMFSGLRQIGAHANATMTIEENEFLTELWSLTRTPPIVRGSLNIVRNARLCLKEIDDFVAYTREHGKELQVTPHTFNEYANGYLTSCESNQLNITIDRIRSSSVQVIVVVPKQLTNRTEGIAEHLRRSFLSVYYKQSKTKNETHYDVTHSQQWLRLVEKVNYNPKRRVEIFTLTVKLPSLVGDEWYAAYASITSNVNTVGLISPIVYFQTLPRQPEPVLNLHGELLTGSTVELIWQPPAKSNGPIATYLVYYAPIEDRPPVNNWKVLCLMKDHWRVEESVSMNKYNLTQTNRCDRSNSSRMDFLGTSEEEFDEDRVEKKNADQINTDLSILERHLINSIGHRRDPLHIQKELKEAIIVDLDKLIDNPSSSGTDDKLESESDEQTVVDHQPYVNDFNQSTVATRILIEDLKQAQMYMFQVYACHDITRASLSDACSINGIIITVRTKPGDPSRDLVRDVKILELESNSPSDSKSFQYQISWSPPLEPNGLIYFYLIYVEQNEHDGPKQESCVGNDVFALNVTLAPRTHYRLRIITYTVARLNNEYNDREQIQDGRVSLNGTHLFYEEFFHTKDLSSELARQSRLVFLILIIGSILLFLIIIIGAPCYYYTYGQQIAKASISKNPNYELYTPDQWEIDKDSISLERLIGQGHFGQVYQGVLKLQDGTLKSCAVKIRTTHPKDLLQEASIMKQFQCYHVIQLYGICSRIRPPYVVMELMEHGDLKNYLYRHRQSDQNLNGPTLSESAMIQLALDVADGMYYLADQKFVHRDLAARNCLVNGNHTCKVGDFGLTRDIYETDYYRPDGRRFLPIRWMAPESLRDGRFESVSDVWSYGVLLWEIATLAEQPYQGYGNEEVVHYVRNGNITLERPRNCPEILRKLMRACWAFSPSDRIQFRAIVEELLPYQNADFRLHAYYYTQPNPNLNSVAAGNENIQLDEEDLLLTHEDHENIHH